MRTFLTFLWGLYIKLSNSNTCLLSSRSKFFFSIIKVVSGNRCCLFNSYCNQSSIQLSGFGNLAEISGNLYRCKIQIEGDNNRLCIGDECKVYNTNIRIKGSNCVIILGKYTTIGGAQIVCMGRVCNIEVGESCMIADCVDIWNTDSHPIFRLDDGMQVNTSQSIKIGSNVWIGKSAAILKGVFIQDGAIIGMHSVVTKTVEANSIYAGSPAKKVRENVRWERTYTEI